MNYQDSSSEDIPYLPPDQYAAYEQQRNSGLVGEPGSLSQPEQRRGRSFFTEDEIRQLDSPGPFVEVPIHGGEDESIPYRNNSIPVPPLTPISRNSGDLKPSRHSLQFSSHNVQNDSAAKSMYSSNPKFEISWGRRIIGVLLVMIPAALFGTAAHFVDWSMSDFQLFSASFFIFQGVLWPSFGILLTDLFCASRKPTKHESSSPIAYSASTINDKNTYSTKQKCIRVAWIVIHGNLTSLAMIFQLLAIQRLNISISLALSFGFDAIVSLFRYVLNNRACSPELAILSLVSYAGYAVAAVPAFVEDDKNVRFDTAVGVGASVGVLLLSTPASLLLPKLREGHVPESVLGTSFAFFGCIHSALVKEIMGSTLNLSLTGRAVGWAAGLISVVCLGTIMLFLESKLSSLIWQRDEDDLPRQFSSLTRTRVAVFIISCIWELSRQGFRETFPSIYDILGGFLVMISFLLVSGYDAWNKTCQNDRQAATDSSNAAVADRSSRKFCAFIPWLFAQKSNPFEK